jgi:hypothetical protein
MRNTVQFSMSAQRPSPMRRSSCQHNRGFSYRSSSFCRGVKNSIRLSCIAVTVFFLIIMTSPPPVESFTTTTAGTILSGDTVTGWQSKRSSSRVFESKESASSVSQQIMYNQQCRQREQIHYHIIAAEATEPLGRRMEAAYPDRYTFHPTKWQKFADGTDDIEISGFYPRNLISGQQVLFLASFHNNDVSLSQFQVMIALLQSFIEGVRMCFLWFRSVWAPYRLAAVVF